MGRYYSLNNGTEGKFGFGIQGSRDAEIFGLSPVSITMATYDKEPVEKKLKELLDKVGEEYNEEIARGDCDEVRRKYMELEARVRKRYNLPNYAWSSEATKEENERTEEYSLILNRIYMGVQIMNCLLTDENCYMDCEL